MPLGFHRAIIDRLPDPVVLLDEHGEVVGFNPAARRLFESHPSVLSELTPVLPEGLAQVDIQPLRLNPGTPVVIDGARYAPWLMPTPEDIALVLLPDESANNFARHQPMGSQQDVAFSALLNEELRYELRQVIEKLESCSTDMPAVLPDIQRMHQLLTTISVLCSLLQYPESVSVDRLNLLDLVKQTMARHHIPQARLTESGFARSPTSRHLYGHEPWLLWMLDALLSCMATPREASGSSPDLYLNLRQGDSAIMLSVGLAKGALPAPTPDQNIHAIAPPTHLFEKQRKELDADTRIALASAIAEFHGGQLFIDRDYGDADHAIRQFELTIPLGRAPGREQRVRSDRYVLLSQAEVLARDLAKLLPRRHQSRIAISEEERKMLNSLCEKS